MTDRWEEPDPGDRYRIVVDPISPQTDREKIEAALTVTHQRHKAIGPVTLKPDAAIVPIVERLIRDAATRAFDAGKQSACSSHYAHALASLPADFPLVVAPANGEKERGK